MEIRKALLVGTINGGYHLNLKEEEIRSIADEQRFLTVETISPTGKFETIDLNLNHVMFFKEIDMEIKTEEEIEEEVKEAIA